MSSIGQVSVLRGGKTESVHRISVAVVGRNGEIVRSAGDPHLRTYFRSSAKLLQVIPLLEAGGDRKFGLTAGEVTVMAASHDGEAMHTEAVSSILSKIGLEERHLFCGPHEPYSLQASQILRKAGKEPTRLHNNCSGKHAGMLALSVLEGWPVGDYQLPEHPVQERIFRVIGEATGQRHGEIEHGVDGCGVPSAFVTVFQMALAFSRLVAWSQGDNSKGDAVRRLFSAIREAPLLLEGTNGFSSDLVEATRGRIVGKVGGEGLFCIGILDEGLGIALKVEDGNRRATSPAAVEVLKAMKLLSRRELEILSGHHHPPIVNHQGLEVGRLVPEIRFGR